jgi:hypothetical protein
LFNPANALFEAAIALFDPATALFLRGRALFWSGFKNTAADKLECAGRLARQRFGVRQPSAAFASPVLPVEKRQGTAALQDLAELFRRAGKSWSQFY